MADDNINLDAIGDVTDETELNKTLNRLRGLPEEAPPPPPEPEVVVQPEGEPAPVVEPEPKPEPVVVAPVPEPPKPEDDQTTLANRLGKRIRLLEQQLEAERIKGAPPPAAPEPPKTPGFIDDPAEYLKTKTESLEGEISRLRMEQADKDRRAAVVAAEQEFLRTQPDYWEARNWLLERETREWQKMGQATKGVRELRDACERGKADPNFKRFTDHVNAIASRPEVRAQATEKGEDPYETALYSVARDTYLLSRQQLLIDGAQADGVNPAQRAYELAQDRGYVHTAAAPDAAAVTEPVVRPVDPNAARERVLRAQQISEAANSLSDSPSAEGGPTPRVLRNRNDVLALENDALDALIASGRYKEL